MFGSPCSGEGAKSAKLTMNGKNTKKPIPQGQMGDLTKLLLVLLFALSQVGCDIQLHHDAEGHKHRESTVLPLKHVEL